MLRLYQPCLPTRVYAAPKGSRWQFEPKLDGFRIIARKTRDRIVLQTIVAALKRMRTSTIVLDGEAMCGDSFDNLWNRAADEHVRLCAFDLLEIDGEDFRGKPLTERKRRLAQFLRKDRDGLEYVDHMEGDGTTIFEHACKLGWRGSSASGSTFHTEPAAPSTG